MLAALLCNLGSGPPKPPPPVQASAPRFGGGPFWRRYGYGSAYDDIREELSKELPEIEAKQVERAVTKAVEAISNSPDPEPIVLDAERIYKRVFESVYAERLTAQKIDRLWRAEIQRRLEEEEMLILLID